jgi:hypothetical protein
MYSQAQWQMLAAEVACRWPIQAQSSRSLVCVSRVDWISVQRHVFPTNPPDKTFNLDEVRATLVKTLTVMIRQMKNANYERTFVVHAQPVVSRSEGRAHVKEWLRQQTSAPSADQLKPRVLVAGVIADQERSLRSSFPNVELTFWRSDETVSRNVNLDGFDFILGMVAKMAHKQDMLLARSNHYRRVGGAFSSLRRELTTWLTNLEPSTS